MNEWKEAVLDALTIVHSYKGCHDNDPRKAVADLVAVEVMIALDPAVSSEAAALVERGRSEAVQTTGPVHTQTTGRCNEGPPASPELPAFWRLLYPLCVLALLAALQISGTMCQ